MRVRLIGVGTRHGDDAAGLLVAERLRRRPWTGVEVVTCERPGAELLDALTGADAVLIVDALRGGGPPGALRRVPPAELRREARLSSHAVGVAEALALAEALRRLPARVEILGIEAGAASPGSAPSPAVLEGAARAEAVIRGLLAELAAPAAEASE